MGPSGSGKSTLAKLIARFWDVDAGAVLVGGIDIRAVSYTHLDVYKRQLYDLRMRILNHMGRLNLGFFTGGQSGAVQKTMNDNIEKMENIIAHDVSNLIGAGLLLVSLSALLFSINVPLALTIVAALLLAFIIQFSAFGGKMCIRDRAVSMPIAT